MDIYNRIAVFRAERGTSRRELADAVGVNPQTIGYLERGDYNPSLELAMKIAVFSTSRSTICFRSSRSNPSPPRCAAPMRRE